MCAFKGTHKYFWIRVIGGKLLASHILLSCSHILLLQRNLTNNYNPNALLWSTVYSLALSKFLVFWPSPHHWRPSLFYPNILKSHLLQIRPLGPGTNSIKIPNLLPLNLLHHTCFKTLYLTSILLPAFTRSIKEFAK